MTQTPRSLAWIRRLIEIDTTSRGANLPLIEIAADAANELGLDAHVRRSADQDGKANLVVTVPDRTGGTSGGIMLCGHTDTVPVDGQHWSSDPFVATERDGRLYARGACDMKAFIGAALNALPEFVEAKLRHPVHLALTYDEEVGCGGAHQLVDDLADLGLTPRVGVVGEPTGMRAVLAHKSMNVVHATFTGVAAHSSLTPAGVNAIEYAARFVTHARGLADRWRHDGPFDEAYLVPYTTCSVNEISGGIAQNTVPDACSVTLEFRSIASVEVTDVLDDLRSCVAAIEADMRREDEHAGAELVVDSRVPGLESAGDGPAAQLVRRLLGSVTADKVTYGTEAGIYAGAGIDTLVLGPGDIAQAHAADEYVDLDQISACEAFFTAVATDLE